MKHWIPFLFSYAFSIQALAQPDGAKICPAALSLTSQGAAVGYDQIAKIYAAYHSDSSWISSNETSAESYILKPVVAREYAVSIVENGDEGESLKVNCLLPEKWSLNIWPKIQIAWPKKLTNVLRDNSVSFQRNASGIMFSSFLAMPKSLDILVFWKALTVDEDVPITFLPESIAPSQLNIVKRRPVMNRTAANVGIRFSDSQTFKPYWHLLTKPVRQSEELQSRSHITIVEAGDPFLASEPNDISLKLISLINFKIFDSSSHSYQLCMPYTFDVEGRPLCYKMIFELYAPLLESVKSNRYFYTQILLKLDDGFILQTHKVYTEEEKVELVRQENLENLRSLNLPESDL